MAQCLMKAASSAYTVILSCQQSWLLWELEVISAGFCQPRIPNKAWSVRFDSSNMYIELAQLLGLSLVYLCLWPCNSPFSRSTKMRSLSSCGAFNHTASCQTGSRTSIIGLKINMILKDIIFITHKLWLVCCKEQSWRFEHQRCLHDMLSTVSAFKDICCPRKKKKDAVIWSQCWKLTLHALICSLFQLMEKEILKDNQENERITHV